MPAYRDKRDGRWRYRKWIVLPNGTRDRITGTPAIDTKVAAEAAERAHIDRVMYPERHAKLVEAAPQRKETPTIREFSKRFLAEYLPRQKPSERYSKERIIASQLVPAFGDLRLDEITQSHVNAYTARCTKVATKTLNNRLAVMSTLLGYAGPTGCKLIPECSLSLHIKAMSAEVVAVPAADVAKLVAACRDDRYRVALLLASEAGLRIGEIRGLQWTDIKGGRLTVRRAVDQRDNVGSPKHDKIRTVRLSPALEAALASLPRLGLWVITTRSGESLGYWAMLEALNALYTSSGVDVPVSASGKTMPWHSLRHTFGTELAARGVPIPTIKELMGHADIATTMRYVTVTGAQMDAAIDRAFGAAGQPVGNGAGSASATKTFSVEDVK